MPIFHELGARQPARFSESQPSFDAACAFCVTVVIEYAMNPDAAHVAHGAVAENRGVFKRNISLIIKAIGHPAAQRFRRKVAFVHGDVEWMFVVVSARADRTQFLDESFAVPNPSSHKTISNPSRAISIPACSAFARSGLPGIRIGFVLFMCV